MIRVAFCVFVIVGVLAYAALDTAIDLDGVVRATARVDVGTWLVVLALSLLNYGLRFGRWHAYLRDLGHRIPPARHLAIYIAGFALTPTPGKVGEGIRALYLKPFGIGIGRSLSTLYAERLLDVISVSFLAALLFVAPVSEFRWLAILGAAITVVLLAAQHPAALVFTQRTLDRMPAGRLQKLGVRATGFQRDVSSLLRADLLAFGLVIGLVSWAAEGLGLYLIAGALDIELGPWSAIGIYATAMLAGALSFVPGGLGSAEAMMVALLALTGAPLPAAVAATLLVRLATLWFAVALGAGAWLGLLASRHGVSVAEAERDTG